MGDDLDAMLNSARIIREQRTGRWKTVRLPWWKAILKRRRTEHVEMTIMEVLADRQRILGGRGDTWREAKIGRVRG